MDKIQLQPHDQVIVNKKKEDKEDKEKVKAKIKDKELSAWTVQNAPVETQHVTYQLDRALKYSFLLTYIFLLTTATITFIEALRTPDPTVRHIMNLETAISLIASYFYSVFIDRIQKAEDGLSAPMTWSDMVKTRYVDWFMTTPIMITVISIVMAKNLRKELHFGTWIILLLLNFSMLGFGYAGEVGYLNKWVADIAGFIPFLLMFGMLYILYIQPKYVFVNYLLFGVYLFIWSLYGFVYLLDEITKNTVFNVLDLISKCLVGLGLWVLFTKIIR